MRNDFKTRLLAKEPMIGTWCMSASATIAEAMGWTGFDFLTVDGEHGPYGRGDILACLRAIAGTPTLPLVRVPSHNIAHIKYLLDIGTQSFLIPMVETPAQAEAIVKATRYPPEGARGFALMHRASNYLAVEDYVHRANRNICVVAQLESPGAIERMEEIAAVPGIDAVFVGPGDLSAAMGLVGQPSHDDVMAVIADVGARANVVGIPCGTLFNRADLAAKCRDYGYTLIAVGSDLAFLTGSARATARELGG